MNNVRGQVQRTGGDMEEFIHAQPLAAVLIALGVGYILGRIGL